MPRVVSNGNGESQLGVGSVTLNVIGAHNPLRTIANKESNVRTDVGVAKSRSDWSRNPSTNQIAIYM